MFGGIGSIAEVSLVYWRLNSLAPKAHRLYSEGLSRGYSNPCSRL